MDNFRSDKYSKLSYDGFIIILLLPFIGTERPDLKNLYRYVLPFYATHWQKIGIFLNIKPGQLEVIKSDNPGDVNGCCIALFIKWLQDSGDATWEKMFEAIDLATVSFAITNTATKVITSKLYSSIDC